MANFKVIWEIELYANNHTDAAKIALKWIQDWTSSAHQFYVQESGCTKVYSVDLNEGDESAELPVTDYVPLINM